MNQKILYYLKYTSVFFEYLHEYQRLFSLNQVILQFTNGAIRAVAKRCMSGTANGPSDGARGLRRVMEEVLEAPQVRPIKRTGLTSKFEVPGGSVRYVLITEDVVNGKIGPLYFGRDGKEQFHETILREEEDYTRRTQKSGLQHTDRAHTKTDKGQQRERQAYGGIP